MPAVLYSVSGVRLSSVNAAMRLPQLVRDEDHARSPACHPTACDFPRGDTEPMKKNVESAMKTNAPDLISMVRAARRQYRPGTGTVYDKLLRQAGSDPVWLADELRSTCGVETVNADEGVGDFSVLNSATATAWRCVVLRCVADNVLRLGAEDPWDEALLYKASMYVGQPLTPAAVTFADLCRWLGR